jgi:hypothetical protein
MGTLTMTQPETGLGNARPLNLLRTHCEMAGFPTVSLVMVALHT